MESNYKEEITRTRVGALGGSDGGMLMRVCELGEVPKSFYKRLAIVKGLIEQEDISTPQMRFGDFIEQSIYDNLVGINEDYQSNPMWTSKVYSKENCKLICHPDFVLEDKEKHILKVYECKATKYGIEQTKDNYQGQLFIEYTLACERAKELGSDWGVQLFLCHYNTNGVDLNDEFSFDPNRLTIRKLHKQRHIFDIDMAMTIVSKFLEDFNEYYEDDEIDYSYLPTSAQTQFMEISKVMKQINDMQEEVNKFKEKIYTFFMERGIKKVSCEDFSFTIVEPSKSVSFDFKKFLKNYEASHPRLAKKLREKYRKESERKGYVKISVKGEE